jgi:acetyl-CoA acetyltransferase
MSNIYIVGVGMTPFGRHIERSIESLMGEALVGAVKDAGCSKSDIGTAFYSNTTQGVLHGQTYVPGQITLSKVAKKGEYTEAIITELGLSVEQLKSDGVI